MTEDHASDALVVEPGVGLAAEQAVGEPSTRGDCHWCQLPTAGHVADGVDAGHVGSLKIVDANLGARTTLHSDAVETQAVAVGHAPGCPNQRVEAGVRPLVLSHDRERSVRAGRDSAQLVGGHQADTRRGHLAGQRRREHFIEAAQQLIAAQK
jgi:hypothetical protein